MYIDIEIYRDGRESDGSLVAPASQAVCNRCAHCFFFCGCVGLLPPVMRMHLYTCTCTCPPSYLTPDICIYICTYIPRLTWTQFVQGSSGTCQPGV